MSAKRIILGGLIAIIAAATAAVTTQDASAAECNWSPELGQCEGQLVTDQEAGEVNAEAAPTPTPTPTHALLGCWGSHHGTYSWLPLKKPARCDFNGDEAHALQTNLRKMRWRTWGGPLACGRGTYAYNGGYRASVRFCAYKRVRDGNAWFYTRIRGTVLPGHDLWGPVNKTWHFDSEVS